MRIIKKEVKKCDDCNKSNSDKTLVLDLLYTHRGKEWRILIKDYKEEYYQDYLKQLRVEVRNTYNEQNLKRDIN